MASVKESMNTNYMTTRDLYASLPFDNGQATLFVREKGASRTTHTNDSDDAKEPQRKRARISGEEAKQFYEDVLLMPEESRTSEGSTRKKLVKVKRRKKRETKVQSSPSFKEITSPAQLFLCAQHGDLEQVRRALSRGLCDINAVDSFNWTLLMCAAHAGHMTIVRYLLDKGADWRNYMDRRGNNAADLAKIAGQSHLAQFIEGHTGTTHSKHGSAAHSHEHSRTKSGTYYRDKRHSSSTSDSRQSHGSSFYCEICKMTVELGSSTTSNHTTSTVHQFSCQHKPKVTPYGIPESNRGFQLLLKGGWDPERGLGPDQQGQKFPVKTVLKQDRLGFGLSTRAKPRVTHFSAHDEAAVKSHRDVFRKEKAQPKKKDIVKAAERDRRWEIRMRRYMNTDYDLPV